MALTEQRHSASSAIGDNLTEHEGDEGHPRAMRVAFDIWASDLVKPRNAN